MYNLKKRECKFCTDNDLDNCVPWPIREPDTKGMTDKYGLLWAQIKQRYSVLIDPFT